MTILEVKELSYEVKELEILKDISFKIEAGQHTSISGPSGSGKSTILKMLALLLEPTRGKILYQNENIESLKSQDYRREVSYSYQSPQLFGKTVEDNLSFPAKIREMEFDAHRAEVLLKDVGLNYIDLSKDINGLSGGEKQRVALIRNIMYPPKILLLDEVTAGLDEANGQQIWAWLLKRSKEERITMIWVSHNELEQQIAVQQIFVNQGKLIERKIN